MPAISRIPLKLPKFEVSAIVEGMGKVHHVIRAADSMAAIERFKKAYSKHEVLQAAALEACGEE